ncbi:hypothetical protein D3C71_2120720 [compost metagenome]
MPVKCMLQMAPPMVRLAGILSSWWPSPRSRKKVDRSMAAMLAAMATPTEMATMPGW